MRRAAEARDISVGAFIDEAWATALKLREMPEKPPIVLFAVGGVHAPGSISIAHGRSKSRTTKPGTGAGLVDPRCFLST